MQPATEGSLDSVAGFVVWESAAKRERGDALGSVRSDRTQIERARGRTLVLAG